MAIKLDALSPSELQALIKSAEAQMAASRQSHIKDNLPLTGARAARTSSPLRFVCTMP